MGRKIKLSEEQLRSVIAESVEKILNEFDFSDKAKYYGIARGKELAASKEGRKLDAKKYHDQALRFRDRAVDDYNQNYGVNVDDNNTGTEHHRLGSLSYDPETKKGNATTYTWDSRSQNPSSLQTTVYNDGTIPSERENNDGSIANAELSNKLIRMARMGKDQLQKTATKFPRYNVAQADGAEQFRPVAESEKKRIDKLIAEAIKKVLKEQD